MVLNTATAFQSPHKLAQTYRVLFFGLVFVVALLLALITLPSATNGRAEALRTHLDADVQGFATALTATENSLQEMQSAARGYLLTEAPVFLEQYRAAQDSLPARLHDLEQLGPRVDPALTEPVADLLLMIERWQQEAGDRRIALVQGGQRAAAVAEVASGSSQAIFDSFRDRVNDLQERTQMAQADLIQQINSARTLQVGLTSGLGVLGLLGVSFVVFGFRSLVMLMRDLQAERERTAALAQETRTERQRLQTLFDHSPEGIVFAEAPAGQFSLINPAAATLLGPVAPDQPLRSQPWAARSYRPGGELYLVDDLPLVRTIEQGVACRNVELTIEQPDGQRVPVLLTSVPLHAENGSLRGAVAVFQDLRSLREVERLKSDFVALVSHELRTPLTAIQGCVEGLLLSGEVDTVRTRSFLQIISEQSERLEELIDNLLSMSQVEAGALRLRRGLVQPQPLIQGVLRQLRDRMSGLRVQTDLAPDLPLVSADERRIEQVLFNLLDNARKFSPPNGVITISAAQAASSVTICVRDQGPGVPAAERERVFERFFQLEQTATRNIGGSGLGLAICKGIVEAHGGQIRVDDAPGGGAQFCFTLPAMPSDERQALTTSPVIKRPHHGTTHVLVVDDDPALRRLLETSLPDTAGYSVQSVVEAHGAVEAVSRNAPDVILLDVMLPGMDGFEVCRQLREWTNVPIIMLTALTSEKDVVLGLQLGADDYIAKPFRTSELVARIEAVLRRTQFDVTPGSPSLIQVGELAIDMAERRVTVDGTAVNLTPIEYQILTCLARHVGQVLTHSQILQEVWGEAYRDENHYLWVHVAHLRQKLEANSKQPRYLLTERGVGYRLAKE